MKKIILAFSACFLLQSSVGCYPGPSEEELRAQEELDARLNSILREARQISFQILLQESAKKYYRKIIAVYKKIKEEAESISLNRQKSEQEAAKLEALLGDLRLGLGLDALLDGDVLSEDHLYLIDKCALLLEKESGAPLENAAAGAKLADAPPPLPDEGLKKRAAGAEESAAQPAASGVFAVGFPKEPGEEAKNGGAEGAAPLSPLPAETLDDNPAEAKAAAPGSENPDAEAVSTEAADDAAPALSGEAKAPGGEPGAELSAEGLTEFCLLLLEIIASEGGKLRGRGRGRRPQCGGEKSFCEPCRPG